MATKKVKVQEQGQLTSTRPQIAILDFGSQFSHLIARRIREANVFCELYSCKVSVDKLKEKNIVGIILSGGPSSVYDADAPHCSPGFWEFCTSKSIPILGICYGMQEMTNHFGGSVEPSHKREFGQSSLEITTPSPLFQDIPTTSTVWMSHGDKVVKGAEGFEAIAISDNSPYAAVHKLNSNWFGIQFHPEVTHTQFGKKILANFCINICQAPTDWNMKLIADAFVDKVRATVGEHAHVIGAVSGGVDSSVAAVLLNKAIGKRFHAIMVDNGCLRLDEGKSVVERLKTVSAEGIDLHLVDASDRFLTALSPISDPELKRKTIGKLFIEVFQDEAERIAKNLPAGETVEYLLQGTLYPDVIESESYKGPSATIKSHHNVGGLPDTLKIEIN